jgi:hypothetical protein
MVVAGRPQAARPIGARSILPPMSSRRTSHRALHLAAVAVAGAPVAFAMLGAGAACGPVHEVFWLCLNAVTGKEDVNTYDANNYADGEPDPCHCYDPCGPAKTCPIVVDAGPSGPDCGAGGGAP